MFLFSLYLYCIMYIFFFHCSCDHRDLHVLTHAFPTRRASDLRPHRQAPRILQRAGGIALAEDRHGQAASREGRAGLPEPSERSARAKNVTYMSRKESAPPNGQSFAALNWRSIRLPIIWLAGPPSSTGGRKAPSAGMNGMEGPGEQPG